MAITGRIRGDSFTGSIRPNVYISSMTECPIGTIFSLWWNSRHEDIIEPVAVECLYKYYNPEDNSDDITDAWNKLLVNKICEAYPESAGEDGKDYKNVIRTIIKQCLQADLPPTESVNFTICADQVTVAWREQLVRSKLASYWTQTSRTADLTTMDVNMADTISMIGGAPAVEKYKDCVETIRETYKYLTDLGIPVEDIRLAPEARVHRVPGWMISLRALIKILNKRSDWIAQSSLWSPIISGVCKSLREKDKYLYDIIKDMIGKPSADLSRDEEGKLYVYDHYYSVENDDRLYGRDPQPVDPLYLAYKKVSMPEGTDLVFYDYMKSLYINIWNDDYLEILGWDRNDPNHLGYYDRPFMTED